MKLKYLRVLIAKEPMTALVKKEISPAICRKLYKQVKAMEAELEYYYLEESKITEKYAMKDESGKVMCDENRMLLFDNDENKQAWTTQIEELLNSDTDISDEPIKAKASDIKDFISVDALVQLEGVFELEEE